MHDANVYGQSCRQWLEQHAAEDGYAVAGAEAVTSRNPANLQPALRTLAEKGADGVVMALYPAQAKTLMQAKQAIGFGGRMVSVGPLTDEEYLLLPGGAADGTLGFCYYPDPNHDDHPEILAYRAAMRHFAGNKAMNRYSLYGFVYGRLIVEGLRRTGRGLTWEGADVGGVHRCDGEYSGLEFGGDDAGGFVLGQQPSCAGGGFLCELKAGRFEALGPWVAP